MIRKSAPRQIVGQRKSRFGLSQWPSIHSTGSPDHFQGMGNVGKFNHVATDSSGGQATARWRLPDMMIASRDQQGVSSSGSSPLDRVHLEPPPLPSSAAALFLDLDGTLLDFA